MITISHEDSGKKNSSNEVECSNINEIGSKNNQNSLNTQDNPDHPKTISLQDVLRSKPKFLIFSLLSMYPELSLKEIKDFTGKSKSTISIHLSDMERMGLVVVSREEKARGSIPTKYFRLVENYEEKLAKRKCYGSEVTDAELKEFIQIHQAFAQVQSQFLNKWMKYLTALEKRLENQSDQEIRDEIKKMKTDQSRLSVVSFYSAETAKEFRKSVLDAYKIAEEATFKETSKGSTLHPYFIGMQMLNIKKAFDYFL